MDRFVGEGFVRIVTLSVEWVGGKVGTRRGGRALKREGVQEVESKSRNGSWKMASQAALDDCSESFLRILMSVRLAGEGCGDGKLPAWPSISSSTVGVSHTHSDTFVNQSLIRSLGRTVRLEVRFQEPAMK
jgi:ribonuclease BN (tRNA processing enzyme)